MFAVSSNTARIGDRMSALSIAPFTVGFMNLTAGQKRSNGWLNPCQSGRDRPLYSHLAPGHGHRP